MAMRRAISDVVDSIATTIDILTTEMVNGQSNMATISGEENNHQSQQNLPHGVSSIINNNNSSNSTVTQPTTATNTNHNEEVFTTNNQPRLIKIAEINNRITFLWKIQGAVTCEYPKRTFMNTTGSGEISGWDLTDESGTISLIAFNLNSYMLSNKLEKDKVYEFTNLSIRPARDTFKTLPHLFQLVSTNGTQVQQIHLAFNKTQIISNFTHLNQIDNMPLNSIINIQVYVLRDYGISTGNHNENLWSRRDLHVNQDGTQIRITLWNNQARFMEQSMVGHHIKLKHVKISSFDGLRTLTTIPNTEISLV